MVSSLQHSETGVTTLSEEEQLRYEILERDMARLMRYIEQMHHDITAVESSRAWRIGYRVMSIIKRCLGRPIGSDSFASIHTTYSKYHHWKKTRG